MNVSPKEVLTESRARPLIYVRAFYSKYMTSLGIYSLNQIGDQLGRTHASIINAVKNANNLIETERYFYDKWELFMELVTKLTNPDTDVA